jgi:predicted transcriptional regulator
MVPYTNIPCVSALPSNAIHKPRDSRILKDFTKCNYTGSEHKIHSFTMKSRSSPRYGASLVVALALFVSSSFVTPLCASPSAPTSRQIMIGAGPIAFLPDFSASGGFITVARSAAAIDQSMNNLQSVPAAGAFLVTTSGGSVLTPPSGDSSQTVSAAPVPSASGVFVQVQTTPFGRSVTVETAAPSSPGLLSPNAIAKGAVVYVEASSANGQSQVYFLTRGGFSVTESVSNLNSFPTLSSITSAIPGLWLDSSKRRSRSQIYVEILELMKRGPMTPFEIAFYARLNRKRTKQYTKFLRQAGYLESRDEEGRTTYALSSSGLAFLEKFKTVFEFEDAKSTEFPYLGYAR